MSLTTGWDCPRAETMMSFRRAKDHTLIAQLVGRMVRTPLARAIEGQEFLNTVSLYLPHYDESGLQAVLDKLGNPDPEISLPIGVVRGNQLVQLNRASDKDELFSQLEDLPIYRAERKDKTSDVRRLMKLGRRLTFDEIDENALRKAKKLVIGILNKELRRLSSRKDFASRLAENQELVVREVQVEYGEWKDIDTSKTTRLRITPENIDDLFEQCGRMLGEGLHLEFWKAHRNLDDPYRAKLELFAILQERKIWSKLEKRCGEQIKEWFALYREEIRQLPTSKQEHYNRIHRIAKIPEAERLFTPLNLMMLQEEPYWEKHLYVNGQGKFCARLNGWEAAVLRVELAKPNVVAWLRNIPRKPWALSITYKMANEYRTVYPDLIIFRSDKGKLLMDLLDPHSIALLDAVPKAKGFAEYAQKHGEQFGRIELIIMNYRGELQRLNVNDTEICDKVLKVSSQAHLDLLFNEFGQTV
jgi:type III restriction enzyme